MTNRLSAPHALRGLFAALILSFPQLQAEPVAVSNGERVLAATGKSQQMSSPDQVPQGLAKSDWQSIRAAHEAGRHAFQPVQGKDGHWQAQNPGQQWHTTFDQRGFMASPLGGGWTWGLELQSYGFGENQTSISGIPQVKAEGQRLAYQWDATVQEWYVNDQRGLEHGFTLAERPTAGSATSSQPAPLTFTLSTRGGLKPKVAADSVQFQNASGTTVLNYSGLKVWDADGRTLPARFEPSGIHGFRLLVDESTARYPITIDPIAQQAYLKASNSMGQDRFGFSVAVDGDTAVIGAHQQMSAPDSSGSAYVFTRSAGVWTQQAILKASNGGPGDLFGFSVAVDGDTIIVGARNEDSNARTVNGDGSNNSASNSGAAYIFTRSAGVWTQQAYLKANNADADDDFGYSVNVSGDTAVVGARLEDGDATTVNGNGSTNSASGSGAAYVFTRSAGAWTQQAYLKSSNSGAGDNFGVSVAVDVDTILVGASFEDGSATTVNGTVNDNATSAGAAYVFTRSAGVWTQQAYLKANNSELADLFGIYVALDGDTAVIGSINESSNAKTVNGNGSNNNAPSSGAAYVFTRSAGTWTQQAYLKANNSGVDDRFGTSVAVSGDVVVVGANAEDSSSTGIDSTPNELAADSGAAYVYFRSSGAWSQQSYLKANQFSPGDFFGGAVAVSGGTVLVGAQLEDGSNTGINSTPNELASSSGAAYIFTGLGPVVPAPTLTNVSPATGSTLGGTVVTITGTDFTDASAVTFGGTNATSFTVNSATQITATTPAGTAGTASVLVTTPGGTNAANTLYTYVIPQTTVTSVTSSSPNGTYMPGNSVSITVAFSENVAVTGTPTLTLETGTTDQTASFDSVSGSEMTFVYSVQLGDSATDLDYISNAALSLNSGTILATADGSPANLTLPAPGAPGSLGANKNIVIRTPVPVVSYVESDTGLTSGGASVSIYGGPFFGSTTVTFGGVPATNLLVTGSRIFCTTPAHPFGPVNVEVTTPAGTSEPNTAFTYYNTTLTGGWASNSSGIPVALHNVHFVSASTGWASGDSGMIHKSTDGGVTWTSQSSSQTAASYNTLFGLTFADANTGWASSAFGTLIKTTDGGDNWLQQSPSTGQQIWTVFAHTPTTAWIAGSAGMIGRTTDGTNWSSSLNNPPGNPNTGLNDIQFVDANNGYAIAGGGWSAKTTDGGATWTQMPGALPNGGVSNSYRLAALSFVDVNTGWAVGSQGTIIKTTDGGATWVSQNSGVLTQTLHSVSFVDANKGWAVGDTGIILQTVNGGTTWTVVNSGTGFVFLDVHFIDETTGWVVGDFGRVLRYSAPQVAPVVSLVSPASGTTEGGSVVTITGTNFTNASSVTFGGTNATSFTVNSATQITATTPAHAAGAVSVLVTTPGGTNAANSLYTYVVPNFAPVITSNGGDATASINVAENSTAVTTVTATDADLPAQTLTYTKSGADAAFFNLDSTTGVLSFISAPNFEAPADSGLNNIYDVTVTVTDSGTPSLADTQAISIIVTDVNETPAVRVSSSFLAYETVTPNRNGSGLIVYTVNNAATLAAQPFNRVRYRMENTIGGVAYFADASVDAWGGLTVDGLKMPDAGNTVTTQRNVTNVSIRSNHPRVVNSNTELGRLELWTNNYVPAAVIGGSGTLYDYDDTPQAPILGYGSFQLHNLSATVPETVFAWNNHTAGLIPDVGFGNATVGIHPDWTYANTGTNAWRMQIYIENNFVPPTMSFTEDVTGNILFFNSPFQDDSASLTVTLAVVDGTVTGNAGTGITVGGTATSRTFTGSVADLNAYFTTPGKVTYLGALNNTVSRTLTVTVSDGSLSTNTTSTIYLAPVNDVPAVAATLTDTSWTPTATMSVARIFHTATRLADGRVLVAGGTNGAALASAQIFDPVLGTWTATGSMVSVRQLHKAVRLANGKVLVAGGYDAGGVSQTSELYDPATGTWTASGNLGTPRVDYTMTLLTDGRVLIAGGRNSSFRVATAEIYNPATNTWTVTGSIAVTRWSHTAALLPDGRVLIAGGDVSNTATVQTASAEIYNPVTGTWTTTSSMTAARYEHAMERLPDGRVMVAGGFNGNSTLASAEIYNPTTATWAMTGSMNAGRGYTSMTPLSDGQVLISGGRRLSPSTFLSSAEIYNPALGTWTTTSSMGTPRQLHTTTALADGRVLVTGGEGNSVLQNSAEIFAPRVAGAEGATLTQTGTFSDVDGTATVTLTASSGTVTQNTTLGTWSWSPVAGFDGPSSSNVTITATDSASSVVKAVFTFAPTNAVPTVQINPPSTLVTNVALNFQFVATDTATADQAAGFAWSINFGDGSGVQSVPAGTASPLTRSHTYTQSGDYVVTATATDKDGGVSIAATASVTILGSEIAVSGNGNLIVDGDSTPALADHTDFGSLSVSSGSVSRTFTIANTGSAALNLTGTAPNYVTISGSTDFMVTTQPTTPIAATSGSTTFVVTFDPSSGGIKNAMVNIANDDLDETPYNFAITGEGKVPEPIPSALGDVVTAGDAPGANGTTNIGEFGVLRRGGFLAENGHLVFPGFLQLGSGSPAVTAASNSGIWKTAGGNLFLVVRTGTLVPDLPGTLFATVPEVPGVSDSGEVSMLSTLVIGSGGVTTANDTGLWSEIGGGGLRLLLREDDNIPSLAGVKVGSFASGIYATARTGASTGEAVFSVTYKGASTKTALLRTSVSGATTTVSVVAQEGELAPGTSPAANYVSVAGSYSDPGRMDAQGNFVYAALTTPGNKEGIWYQPVTGGTPNKVFFAGETAPGTGGATFARLQRPSMGSNGFISFRASLNRDGDNAANARNDGIWNGSASNPASFTCVLRRGDGVAKVSNLPVGSLVGNPWGGWLTNSNLGAWRAWLDVDGDGISSTADGDVNAIFANLSGTMQLAVKVGDVAPGTTGATFSGFDLPMVGGNNQYAILGNLTGGDSVTANNQGLWKSGPNGGALTLVMRKGATITTTEGTKTVTKIDVPGSNQTDRRWEQPVMDSTGQMVVYVTFSDGSTSQVIVP